MHHPIFKSLVLSDFYATALSYAGISGIQASNYTGTLDVKPNGAGSSVEWRVQYLADDQPDFIVRTIVTTLLKTGLASLQARFGAQK